MRFTFESLRKVRDKTQLSGRNKSSFVREFSTIFHALSNGLPIENLREEIFEGKLFFHSSYNTRRGIWNHFHRRFIVFNNDWVIQSLVVASKDGINSSSFLSLSYLYYVLRDRFTFNFVTGPLWERWKKHIVSIDREDVRSFLEKESENNTIIDRWHDRTKRNVASNILTALRDFGVLRGVQRKRIQHPTISSETVYHLLCILMAEGLRGQSIIEALDWRMFLWSEADIANALNELSIRRWIEFEKTGRIAIIELKRKPEV